jgi:hypothetical protein
VRNDVKKDQSADGDEREAVERSQRSLQASGDLMNEWSDDENCEA